MLKKILPPALCKSLRRFLRGASSIFGHGLRNDYRAHSAPRETQRRLRVIGQLLAVILDASRV